MMAKHWNHHALAGACSRCDANAANRRIRGSFKTRCGVRLRNLANMALIFDNDRFPDDFRLSPVAVA
jgi:hypothetical protein